MSQTKQRIPCPYSSHRAGWHYLGSLHWTGHTREREIDLISDYSALVSLPPTYIVAFSHPHTNQTFLPPPSLPYSFPPSLPPLLPPSNIPTYMCTFLKISFFLPTFPSYFSFPFRLAIFLTHYFKLTDTVVSISICLTLVFSSSYIHMAHIFMNVVYTANPSPC